MKVKIFIVILFLLFFNLYTIQVNSQQSDWDNIMDAIYELSFDWEEIGVIMESIENENDITNLYSKVVSTKIKVRQLTEEITELYWLDYHKDNQLNIMLHIYSSDLSLQLIQEGIEEENFDKIERGALLMLTGSKILLDII